MLKRLFCLALALATFFWLLKVFLLTYYPDFSSYYYGPKFAFSGLNPYLGGKVFFTPFSYPPIVLLFFTPISLLPFFVAQKIWIAISIMLLISVIYLIFSMYRQDLFSNKALILYSLVFISFPLKFSLGMGQINIIVLFLVVLSIYYLHHQKYVFSGGIMGLAISLKLFPILIIPYFIIRKKTKVLAGMFFAMIALFSIAAIIFPHLNYYFFSNTLPSLLSGWKGDYYNQAVAGFLTREVKNIPLRNGIRYMIDLLLIAVSFFAIAKQKSVKMEMINLEIGLIIILSILINSFSWQHHYIWSILPFLFAFFYITSKELSKYLLIALGISYLLIASNYTYPQNLPLFFQSHVLYGGIILWGINVYLLLYPTHKHKGNHK
ncbi:MAG TPA: glycosyltransferase family 87 protein [Patescibacteria group bacterium]|nr:glycosyltransferase family 87 protein [Patescibacteria group bacterium]